MKPSLTVFIVGAGGITSYLLPVLLKSFKINHLYICDKDDLEKRNLDRQIFNEDYIGVNKAESIVAISDCIGIRKTILAEWFYSNSEVPTNVNIIICCADNHPARAAVLSVSDRENIPCIIGGNEYFDNDAYYYHPEWKNSYLDPRIRHPEILTDKAGDPITCNSEEVLEIFPQLAIANQLAASKIMHLLWVYFSNPLKVNDGNTPVFIRGTLQETESMTGREILKYYEQRNQEAVHN